jgi:hypothetical protein
MGLPLTLIQYTLQGVALLIDDMLSRFTAAQQATRQPLISPYRTVRTIEMIVRVHVK